ncbi:MAG: beta-propeller domain-containing protein [Clostridiaceae bacterium]|nr:beta-propeller domain-containing protein [Clostridiaceae bacterium]
MKKWMLSLLALLLCTALCACTVPAPANGETGNGTSADGPDAPAVPGGVSSGGASASESGTVQPFTLKAAGDYDAVYAALSASLSNDYEKGMGVADLARNSVTGGEEATADAAVPQMAAEAPAATPVDDSAAGGDDYSGTNVQVEGIDEGDIVKTDGKYLYILDQGNTVRIVKAAGEDTRTVASVALEGDNWWGAELYVTDGVMAVLQTTYSYEDGKDGTRTVVTLYDISDPAAPAKIGSLGQDGNYLTSRLMDGVLYLVSRHYVWYWTQDGVTPDPRNYVPCFYDGGQETVLDADRILLPPENTDSSYTVLSALEVKTGKRLSEQAVMGSVDTAYMNGENLYLAGSRYDQTESEPRTENQYTVVDWQNENVTTLTRFALSGGDLTAEATGTVPGYLLNQFSMDEQGGYLRLVTTLNRYSYSVYTDEAYGFTNYKEGENDQCNALYVLDENLQTVGKIDNLAQDERVYSVRFDGNIGYFVTYRQVDPLFAVDLSDPSAPSILGELKIPGFSQYLHVYGEGRLFGLGQNTTEKEGDFTVSDGMKLSMFDVSDPADVSEISMLRLPGNWSEALYNHKAILILPQKNIIAFPMDGGYAVYGYDEAGGFYSRAEMEVQDLSWDGLRGVQIGDLLYVCARNGVGVYSLSDFARLAQIAF